MKRIFYVWLVLIIALGMCGCVSQDGQSGADYDQMKSESLRKTVMYFQTDEGYIIPVMKQIPWEEGIAKATLSYLVGTKENMEEASRCGLKTVIPEGTEFALKISNDKTAVLNIINLPNFSDEKSERVFITTVVNTLTEFDAIEKVSFRFDGKKLDKLSNGTPISDNMNRFSLNPVMQDKETSTNNAKSLTVYVPDKTYMYNIPITCYSQKSDFKSAMDVFTECCVSVGNGISKDVQLVSATIDGNTATVEFSSGYNDFVSMTDGVSEAMYKAIYLTAKEFSDISDLKLYAGNKLMNEGSMPVSAPLYVNEWQ